LAAGDSTSNNGCAVVEWFIIDSDTMTNIKLIKMTGVIRWIIFNPATVVMLLPRFSPR
jgi:hypothetical protein